MLALRRLPFSLLAISLAIVAVTVANLPASFVSDLGMRDGLDPAQAGWLYRLLAVAAAAQAVYGAFFVVSPGRVAAVRLRHPQARPAMQLFVRTAVMLTGLTFVYGIAALLLTGYRGGFWLFITIAGAQLAWYYLALRAVADAVARHEGPKAGQKRPAWSGTETGYSPPLVRGVRPAPVEAGDRPSDPPSVG